MDDALVELPESWPTEVVEAFWAAAAGPTYEESAVNTLRFAELLAKMIRDDRTVYGYAETDQLLYANLIFPVEES